MGVWAPAISSPSSPSPSPSIHPRHHPDTHPSPIPILAPGESTSIRYHSRCHRPDDRVLLVAEIAARGVLDVEDARGIAVVFDVDTTACSIVAAMRVPFPTAQHAFWPRSQPTSHGHNLQRWPRIPRPILPSVLSSSPCDSPALSMHRQIPQKIRTPHVGSVTPSSLLRHSPSVALPGIRRASSSSCN